MTMIGTQALLQISDGEELLDETEVRCRLPACREGHGPHCRAARALSRALFAQMTETVHLRRQAERHPSSDPDTQPLVLKFGAEALASSDLNEMMLELSYQAW